MINKMCVLSFNQLTVGCVFPRRRKLIIFGNYVDLTITNCSTIDSNNQKVNANQKVVAKNNCQDALK
jgi:hypothetical protein